MVEASHIPNTLDCKDMTVAAKKGLESLLEAATGVAVRAPSDNVRSGSRLLRAVINWRFADQFREEYTKAKAEGRINDSFECSGEAESTLYEMFEFFESAEPDRITFDFLKGIFFSIAGSQAPERTRLLAREMLRLARQLTYPDIAVLSACGQVKSLGRIGTLMSFQDWAKLIALNSGLAHEHVVHRAHNRLVDLGIAYPAVKGEIDISVANGLTSLGMAMYQEFASYSGATVRSI
ncbi:MAG: hypothetical protein KIT19_14330 [Phycisphaeraceae bacterium]|nr:hypothetical protein [Phycisphaeraceae bacterium]